MDCLRVLRESNKSRRQLSHITFRDCRVHIFSDNLSRNSCIQGKGVLTEQLSVKLKWFLLFWHIKTCLVVMYDHTQLLTFSYKIYMRTDRTYKYSWFATTWQGGHVGGQYNRSFPSFSGPLYQNEVKCSAFDRERIFHSHANKTHFYRKGCALGLFLKVRGFGTRKWPIEFFLEEYTWK